MKILHLVFHPNLETSRVNKIWKKQLYESGKITISRDLYQEYPDFKINVEKEQKLLLAHDRIVIQFPLYWYSMTPLLKQWLDDVLTYGFAYGSTGNNLKSKDLQIITSAGGQSKFYSGFDKFSTIYDLLKPFELTANLTKMNYLIPVWMYKADSADEETIAKFGRKWIQLIDDPKRSDPISYLNTEMDFDNDSFYDL
ncbi:MAG: NAD(P)H-dependent oxidoreductase [Bacteroidota bacterium]